MTISAIGSPGSVEPKMSTASSATIENTTRRQPQPVMASG